MPPLNIQIDEWLSQWTSDILQLWLPQSYCVGVGIENKVTSVLGTKVSKLPNCIMSSFPVSMNCHLCKFNMLSNDNSGSLVQHWSSRSLSHFSCDRIWFGYSGHQFLFTSIHSHKTRKLWNIWDTRQKG